MNQIPLTKTNLEEIEITGLSLVDSWNPIKQIKVSFADPSVMRLAVATMIMASGITPVHLSKANDSSALQLCDFFVGAIDHLSTTEELILIDSPRIAREEAKELMERNFVRFNDPRKFKSV